MKQILIATHGKMASGIRYTAELIVGKMAEITTIDAYVTPEDNVEKKFEEYFAQHENDRIFVFTDLMGGSVNQKLLRYSQKENVTLITGTNLPVLMQVMMADDDVTEEEIQEFIDDAREDDLVHDVVQVRHAGIDIVDAADADLNALAGVRKNVVAILDVDLLDH